MFGCPSNVDIGRDDEAIKGERIEKEGEREGGKVRGRKGGLRNGERKARWVEKSLCNSQLKLCS